MRCPFLHYDNLTGTECHLTGASVSDDCGQPKDRPLEDAGECIPRQAIRYLKGDRASFASKPRAEREAIMATAQAIKLRIEKGLLELRTGKKKKEIRRRRKSSRSPGVPDAIGRRLWSAAEQIELERLVKAGVPMTEIAKRLGRQITQCYQRSAALRMRLEA